MEMYANIVNYIWLGVILRRTKCHLLETLGAMKCPHENLHSNHDVHLLSSYEHNLIILARSNR